jgi:ubiquinone/menaquinone biosynthesis C-methylase UbiE
MQHESIIKGPIFIGRGWLEYMKMFNLEEASLANLKILDCAAGASSFTAHLANQGFDIRAVDILYDLKPDELENKCNQHLKMLVKSLSELKNHFVWNFFRNLSELQKHRQNACREFITDYYQHRERYISADLTSLPFPNNEFNLVLCSHLLFIYDHRLDYEFHYNSIKEMLRVCKGDLRIYPLVKHHANKSTYVKQIQKDMADEVEIELVEVNYQFRKGGNEMMVLKKF